MQVMGYMSKTDPDYMDLTSFREILHSGGEFLRTNVPVEGHPDAEPIPTVVFGKKIKTEELPVQSTRAFFIPGQVPSSKNHKCILRKRFIKKERLKELDRNREVDIKGNPRRDYRYYIGNTEAVNNYKQKTDKYYREFADEFRMESAGMSPVYVEFLFVCNSKAMNRDFANMVEIIQEQMSRYSWIIDDSILNLCPVPPLNGPVVAYDKNNPGVRITVLKFRPDKKNP